MISGNPGIIDYYQEFLLKIHNDTAKAVDIFCISHLGHSPHVNLSSDVFSLEENIQHKIDFFDYLDKEYFKDEEVEFIVAGKEHFFFLHGHFIL